MEQKVTREPKKLSEYAHFFEPGTLGFYSHVEVTEIIGWQENCATPHNFLTLVVCEDRIGLEIPADAFLSKQPFRVPLLRGWKFGVYRYYRTIDTFLNGFGAPESGTWALSGNTLKTGNLVLLDPVAVPPDSYLFPPLNKILKNNFASGSYVVEWHDTKKTVFGELFANPPALQQLGEKVQNLVPVGLAALSDRIGNIVVQLPLQILMAAFQPRVSAGGLAVEIAWHPKAEPRTVRAESVRNHDNIVAARGSGTLREGVIVLPMPEGPGDYISAIWDEDRQLLLALTAPSAFITFVHMNMQMINSEPRIFEVDSLHGRETERVRVYSRVPSSVGEPLDAVVGEWAAKRKYRDEISALANRLHFVQYNPKSDDWRAERLRALSDLRRLISTNCEGGAYLWDPYLNARDILDTLFFCPAVGVPLKALTAMRTPPDSDETTAKSAFVVTQRQAFLDAKSNLLGLNLEYRGRFGPKGWDFHDRFLIFPETSEGPQAWSLGCSVNTLGKQHHILQRVTDGQIIADAFLELWNELDQPQHLIWKTP